MNVQYLVSRISDTRNWAFLVNQYFNLRDEPKRIESSSYYLLNNAWGVTGKHLRQSMDLYGKEIRKSARNNTTADTKTTA